MSKFSGKCDLYDHISGMGGWYDRDSNPVTFGQKNVNAYYSDEMKDFEAFKKATDGKLHKHVLIEVTVNNQQFVKNHCKGFDFIEKTEQRTTKSGKVKDCKTYTYTYYGKEYNSLKELNRREVYIEIEIKFNNILELIPYYPYIVAANFSSDGKQYIIISNESFVDKQAKSALQNGYIYGESYKQALQEHYLEVCKEYLLKDYKERFKTIKIENYSEYDKDYYKIEVNSIDYNYDPKYVWANGKITSHWTSPKANDNSILLYKADVDEYLKQDILDNNIYIEYLEKLPGDYIKLC